MSVRDVLVVFDALCVGVGAEDRPKGRLDRRSAEHRGRRRDGEGDSEAAVMPRPLADGTLGGEHAAIATNVDARARELARVEMLREE